MPKKVFLATNISELLSGLIPVKYKDSGCPTIAYTIGQAEISRVLLDWEQVSTCFNSQFINNSSWVILVQLESLSNFLTVQWKLQMEKLMISLSGSESLFTLLIS